MVLVGHSCGGPVITHAAPDGTPERALHEVATRDGRNDLCVRRAPFRDQSAADVPETGASRRRPRASRAPRQAGTVEARALHAVLVLRPDAVTDPVREATRTTR